MTTQSIKETASVKNNALLKKQRVMTYFIDAAKEIANETGIESITIRNVSDRAGYYSASLYNYFENLDQLLAYTAIDLESSFINDLVYIFRSDADSIDKFIQCWGSYAIRAYRNPSIYIYIYRSNKRDYIASCYKGYLEVFPQKFGDISQKTLDMFSIPSFRNQDQFIIDDCIKDGYFRQENRERIIDIANLLHDGLLFRAIQKDNTKTPEDLKDDFLKHFIDFLQVYLQKPKDFSAYLK